MAHWYIKELSKLSNISVRTLRHYDNIGLLKPSIRLPNSYRLYSEADLLKLQQIIALKFFGFELSHIHRLLEKQDDVLTHFHAQQETVQSKISQLQNADRTLTTLIAELKSSGSIQWDSIIQLIEDYRMNEKTKMIWGIDPDKQKEYQNYLVQKGYATTQQIEACNVKTRNWNQKKVEDIKQEQDQVLIALAEMIDKGLDPSDQEVQRLIQKHFDSICNFWTPTKESYIGLGTLYKEHDEFNQFFSHYHLKLAGFLANAMRIYAENKDWNLN